MTSRGQLTRRPATDDDSEYAKSLHHEAYREVVERQFGRWDESAQDGFFTDTWSVEAFDILLWDGAPCGYLSVEDHGEHLQVREIVVSPSHQRIGIGTAVLRSVIEQAAARGLPVVLEALHENRAIELYQRLGFVETGTGATHTQFRHPGRRG